MVLAVLKLLAGATLRPQKQQTNEGTDTHD
jgi:hypothetical protein